MNDVIRFKFTGPPPGASGSLVGCFVPVSSVAREWGVSCRRIRALLGAGRLAGRLADNGVWQVCWPYQVQLGTRGPDLRRSKRKPERKAEHEL